jgi:molybdopterin-guanine dinucleotide biosynthesis protein A
MRFATVILAGGEGRRMGGGKPLALLAGQSLLDRAIALARTWTGDTAVSLRHAGQFAVPEGVFSLLDRDGPGPLAGIRAALDFASEQGLEAVLTIPCDVPFAPADLAGRLYGALLPSAGAALATSGGMLHPACALWKVTALAALPAYGRTGKSSLRGFAAFVGFATAEWPCEPFDPFFNVNSPEDLAVAEALLKNQ